MMKNFRFSFFIVRILFWIHADIVGSQQLCPPPDVPSKGTYYPQARRYSPGEKVTYECSEGTTLVGTSRRRCHFDGNWTDATPFCDVKAPIKSFHAFDVFGNAYVDSKFTDNDTLTCFRVNDEDPIKVFLDRPGSVYAVRLFLRGEPTNIDIFAGDEGVCWYNIPDDERRYVFSKWILILCYNNDAVADSVMIKARSSRSNGVPVCEIEIFVKEDDGCENPPDKRVPYGYFNVTRNLASAVCRRGYRSENDRLVCENNTWIGKNPVCTEILCNSTVTLAPGSEWEQITGSVHYIKPGTRKTLICKDGYKIEGSPETVVCQNDGLWAATNATCVEVENSEEGKSKASVKHKILGVVEIAIAVIIVSL